MSDFFTLQGSIDLNTDAIHISAVANSVDPVTGRPILTHVNRVGGTNRTFAGLEAEFDAQIAAHEVEHANQIAAHELEHDNQIAAHEAEFDGQISTQQTAFNGLISVLGPSITEWTFTTGGQLSNPSQAALYPLNGNYYSWTGDYPHDVAPGTDPTLVGSGYVPRTDVVLRSDLAAPGGSGLIGDFHSVTDKKFAGGASPANTSAQNDAAFRAAEAKAGKDPIYVPQGVFQLTTPRSFDPECYYYGPGKLRFDKAEVWRRGGSAGSLSEKYTIPYEWDDISQMRVTINDVNQTITLFQPRTVEAPPSTPSDTVKILAINGTFQLGTVPVSPLSFNSPDGARNLDGYVPYQPGGNTPRPQGNTFVGPSAGEQMLDGNGNIMIGQAAGLSAVTGDGNILMGPQSLYRALNPNRNVMLGNVTGELATGTCDDNTAIGHAAMGKLGANTVGNTAVGSSALGDAGPTKYAVAVGHRAAGNGVEFDQYGSIAIGAFCMASNRTPYNLGIGYRALGGGGGPGVTGTRNVAIGHSSLLDATSAHDNVLLGTDTGHAGTTFNYCVAVGTSALFSNIGVSELTAVGHESLYANDGGLRNTGVGAYTIRSNSSGNDNTALGWSGLKLTTGSGNTSVGSRTQEQTTTGGNNSTLGFEAGRNITTGSANTFVGTRAGREAGATNDNVGVGSDALQVLTSGATNTAIGRSSLRFMQDTTNATTLTNCTGVGANAKVSGNNQVQIGDSVTTTYVYGTVQNRSDERDKTDVRDTELGIEFIMGLRPVDGRWDMRDDYWEEYDEQVGVDAEGQPVFETKRRQIPKDGSRARQRKHHWFIAQEVKALCDSLGVEFGGYQDHSINGGCDVLSLGYDEFIPPITKAIQQCWQRMDDIERRLDKLDPPEVSS